VPIVRTFTPVVAGGSQMRYRTFATFNAAGGLLWGTGVTVLGYFLGQIAFVKSNIEFILVGIVAISVAPIAVELLWARRRRRQNSPEDQPNAMTEADADRVPLRSPR
jgi:membrane-associated protein